MLLKSSSSLLLYWDWDIDFSNSYCRVLFLFSILSIFSSYIFQVLTAYNWQMKLYIYLKKWECRQRTCSRKGAVTTDHYSLNVIDREEWSKIYLLQFISVFHVSTYVAQKTFVYQISAFHIHVNCLPLLWKSQTTTPNILFCL